MYYPYLRGRQYELIAIRELMERNLINKNIIPIIEPIKETATLKSTLKKGEELNYEIYTVLNPQVGEYVLYDIDHPVTGDKLNLNYDAILMNNSSSVNSNINTLSQSKKFIALYFSRDDIKNFSLLEETGLSPQINFIKDGNRYSRLLRQSGQKIGLIRDAFEKQKRNADYAEKPDEFFSDDHLYYEEEGYSAFSDFSVVGEGYTDGGFAPVAVAIHIVYFDEKNTLRIKHFVSDTNDDISDPAGKFYEALKKLIQWAENTEEKNNSFAIKEFNQLWKEKRYPGLGYVKKLSIMHHLEIMNKYLVSR
ncbi:sce7725 family protein [Macrococcoides canis]|uniref:sce7725 family protein n=1 Tax=Macrococcoides canis TaxID=1855823 RepID=UPI001AEBC578|nr:sce7725 family protein [Macrococcus canis]QTQ08399.1 sce7725 family protein [Macrococcus canis]